MLLFVAMGFVDRESALHVLIPIAIGTTLALAILSWLAARALLLQLPPDFLERPRAPLSRSRALLRTLAGAALMGSGIALLVLPGPGVALIALGALMLAPSWRRRIVRSLVSRPRVLREINAYRRRHGYADLDICRAAHDG